MGEPDAGPPTESVTIILGSEYPDIIVFSSEPDGSLIESTTTNADGKAALLARDGGMVSFSRFSGDLTTFLNVDTEHDLKWLVESGSPAAGQDITVDVPPIIDGSSYQVFSCHDRAAEQDAPVSVDLRIQSECLSGETYSVFGFATSNGELVNYAHAEMDSALGPEGPVALEWQSDFEEYEVEFAYPGLTNFLYAAPVLQYAETEVRVPEHEVDLGDLLFRRPPGQPEELWTELTAYGPDFGWQEHRGALPTDVTEWLHVPAGAVINHTAAVTPQLRWIPTNEGDLVAGLYIWDTGESLGIWQFAGLPEGRIAIFPVLPDSLSMPFGIDPEFAVFFLDYYDYKDLEGYADVMSAGRMAWSATRFLTEDFLRNGGSLAAAGTSASIRSTATRSSVTQRTLQQHPHFRHLSPRTRSSCCVP